MVIQAASVGAARKIKGVIKTIQSNKLIVVGGGTGFIGKRLVEKLNLNGHNVMVVSRMPGPNRMTWLDLDKDGLPDKTYAVVNLAGQNVLDPTRRWTPGFKQNVWSSRVNTTAALARAIALGDSKPSVFVNICGVSIYPPDGITYTEDSPPTKTYDYMSNLCKRWEESTFITNHIPTKVVKMRTGVVLGSDGGMIASLRLPFKCCVGGRIGSGKQPLPWIHIDDMVGLIRFAIDPKVIQEQHFILNAVAPQIITNAEFTKAFARAIGRPALFPMPEFVVNAIFGKERGVMLLTGPMVKPQAALDLGYQFKFADIEAACADVVKGHK